MAKPVDLKRLLSSIEEALGQPQILMIDDDSELCEALCEILREQHYRVALAHDVPVAVARLRQRDHQVVLMDVKPSSDSGADILQFMRKSHAQVRTVLITDFRTDTEAQIAAVMAEGADALAFKSFDVDLLITTLSRLTNSDKS